MENQNDTRNDHDTQKLFNRDSTTTLLLREALAEYMTPEDQSELPENTEASFQMLLQKLFPEKRQGEFRFADLQKLPADLRAELIDGVLYMVNFPDNRRQMLTGEILFQLKQYTSDRNSPCYVFPPSTGVLLDRDDHTFVMPDLLIVRDREKIRPAFIHGAPDFVIEILSPSTSRRDRTVKLQKYQTAGVREYWIIDPVKRRVLVYLFRDGQILQTFLYTFRDTIPIGICDDCSIDFDKISNYLRFLYDSESVNEDVE